MPEINRHSGDWQQLKRWNINKIAELHLLLEKDDLGWADTLVIRGKIAIMREQIENVEPAPEREVKEEDYHG